MVSSYTVCTAISGKASVPTVAEALEATAQVAIEGNRHTSGWAGTGACPSATGKGMAGVVAVTAAATSTSYTTEPTHMQHGRLRWAHPT